MPPAPSPPPSCPTIRSLQDPDASTDDDYVAAFNLALNMAEGEEEEEGGVAAMETEAAAPAAAAGSAGIGAADLAAVLGNILSGGIAGGGASLQQRRLQHALDVGPGLGAVLSSEALAPLLRSDPELVARLAPYLPEEHRWVRVDGAVGSCCRGGGSSVGCAAQRPRLAEQHGCVGCVRRDQATRLCGVREARSSNTAVWGA